METEIIRDVTFGQYRVQGVPHIGLSRPTPTGENFIRDAMVDLKLARIYEHMTANNVHCVDCANF